MDNGNSETVGSESRVMVSPQSLRLPNDLIYQLTTVTGESHGLPDAVGEESLVVASTVPGLVNFRVDSSEEEMVSNIKFGYSEDTKVPMTCMESGICFNLQLERNMTVLMDRPFQVHTWVQQADLVGFITNITSTIDLEVRNSTTVISGVKGMDLKPVSSFSLGMYVYVDGWIGCVTMIEHKLRLLYEKGYECYLIEKEDGFSAYRRNFSYSFVGDEISPSGVDVKSVDWITSPPMLHWFFLRYLNFGYTSNTMAEVVENEINAVTIDWHSSTYPPGKKPSPQPEKEFLKNQLSQLVRLDLAPDWWYGMNVKYVVTDGDQVLDGTKWDEKIAEGFGLKSHGSRPHVPVEQGDTGVDEKQDLKALFPPGREIIGKIVFRRAMAKVLWEDGRSSVLRVQNLTPYYPPPGIEFPLLPGTVVYKPESPFKAVIQTSHRDDGGAWVKWFGEASGDVPDSMQFRSESEEDTYDLEIEESLIHIGLIVIRRNDFVPGVVVGVNIENGMVRVKFGEDIQELETARIVKFCKVAHFIQGQLVWLPLKTHPFTVQKHVVTSSACCTQFGNTIPPQVVTHGAPVKVLAYEELPNAPVSHRFFNLQFALDLDTSSPFIETRNVELEHIKLSPPEGMWIKTYTDRKNLMSVLMRGLPDTPLESGLFQFDVCLPKKYPIDIPRIAYVMHDFEPAQIQLELPEDGLLDMETMFQNKSHLVVSKMLIEIRETLLGLNKKEAQTRLISYTGNIRNLMSNQRVVINLIPAITSWMVNPPALWETEVLGYYRFEAPRYIVRMKKWLAFSLMYVERDMQDEDFNFTEGEGAKFPLLPIDVISHAEIRNDLSDLANAYSKIF